MSASLRAIYAIACATLVLTAGVAVAGDHDWPSYRGPNGAGTSDVPAPVTWNLETGENVRWKTPIPGLAHASPIVWGDHVLVATVVAAEGTPELKIGLYGDIGAAEDDGVQHWWLYALDKATGAVAWKTKMHEGTPSVRRHTKASHANSTPATDGERIVAFVGSELLQAYDMDGKLLWTKDFGSLDAGFFMMPPMQWGFGNSPILHDGKVVVLADVQETAFLAVLDAEDGSELWRVARDEVPTWGTPTILERGDATQILVNGYKHIGAYDFATGAEVWKMAGGGDIPVPTPVLGHDLVFITNAHGRLAPVYAVRQGASGEITLGEEETANDHIAWSVMRGGAYMQTPIVVGDELYVCRDNGVLYCYDARTGTEHYKERLAVGADGFTASVVAAGDKLYYASETGDVHVVQASTTFEIVASNTLDETMMTTPALSDGVLFFRTRDHVVAIGEQAARVAPAAPAAAAEAPAAPTESSGR